MTTSRSRALAALALAITAFVALLGPVAGTGTADAAPTASAPSFGRLQGLVSSPGGRSISVTLTAIGSGQVRKVDLRGSAYSLALEAGTYRVTADDRRPRYDITKATSTSFEVSVPAGGVVRHDIRLRKGSYLTGRVTSPDGAVRAALVRAISAAGTVYEVRANSDGLFALGGLPRDDYSVFGYDPRHRYVARATPVQGLTPSRSQDLHLALGTRGGQLLVGVQGIDGSLTPDTSVTVVSLRTGQYWVSRSHRGTATFPDVFPGRYRVSVGDSSPWLAQTFRTGPVRSGKPRFFTARLSSRGAGLHGRVVDSGGSGAPLAGALVRVFDEYGTERGRVVSGSDGTFSLVGAWDPSVPWTIVVAPDPANGSDYLGTGADRVRFGSTSRSVTLTAPSTTEVGDVALPRVASASASPSASPGS